MYKITEEEVMLKIDKWITKFGKPNKIIADNGTQFTGIKFRKKYEEEGRIKIIKSPIYHPVMESRKDKIV